MVGRFYLAFVAVGSVSGLVVGMYAESYVRQMAFFTLQALWLFTGWKGYSSARRKQFADHGVWMIRSYALTLVAASARLVTPICILVYIAGHRNEPFQGIPAMLEHVLEVNIWVGLLVNFVISEWMIISRLKKGASKIYGKWPYHIYTQKAADVIGGLIINHTTIVRSELPC